MTPRLTTLLKKIFYGSLAGIATSNTAEANDKISTVDLSEGNNKIESFSKKKVDLTPKMLLKKSENNELIFVSHRSHRSHSSHRSHYSSSSGGGGTTPSYTPKSTYTPPKSTYSPPSNSYTPPATLYSTPNNNSGLKRNVPATAKSTAALRLGARTLKRGMKGTDVTELVNILLRKQYLTLEGGGPAVGTYTYDAVVEEAVKEFQIYNGLTNDGICGPTTIYYLKNK